MPNIRIGENAVIDRLLFYSNGSTPLLRSDLVYLSSEIVQYGKVKASYVLISDPMPNPVQGQIEGGDSTNGVRTHMTEEVSATMRQGEVIIRIKMRKANSIYYDPNQYDIDEHSPFSMI